MSRAKNNRGTGREFNIDIDPALDLSPEDLRSGTSKYQDWHWGLPARKVVDWDDPDMPKTLIECGRLVRLHIRSPKRYTPVKHPRRERDTMILFSRDVSDNSHIAYDPSHPDERLYLLVDPRARTTLKKRFWDENQFREMPLSEVAMVAGGRHGRHPDYPAVAVKLIGVVPAVVYFTSKKGDGESFYIHRMGELSHFFPVLCCDAEGRLWLAGGNYKTPNPGITD